MTTAKAGGRKFIVAFNRDRDGYQVPLALAEADRLERLVTDYYAPTIGGVAALSHRRHPELRHQLTSGNLRAVLLQAIGPKFRMDVTEMLWQIDRLLGSQARRLARRTDADLLLYSRYAYESFTDPALLNRRRGLFVFHPHWRLIDEILEQDRVRFPDFRWEGKDGAPSARQQHREDVEIKQAGFAIAASTFTKRSIIYAGMDAAAVRVVPYGTAIVPAQNAARESGKCRFLFVGQGQHRKGLHHLLLAWKQLALPNATLTLVCYSMDAALKPLLPMPGVLLRSRLSRQELDAEFMGAHVFTMPSLVEGFGLVYLEALAAGCYLIGTENTGFPDLQLGENMGSSVPAGDVEAIARQLEHAYHLHRSKEIDHAAIARHAATLGWDRFRAGIRAALL